LDITLLKVVFILLSLLASTNCDDFVLDATTNVTLIGTAGMFTNPVRSGQSVAIRTNEGNVYFVDAGRDVVDKSLKANIKTNEFKVIFITHLHSDHTVGLTDFILTSASESQRNFVLKVYGPIGIQKMIDHILKGWEEDIYQRTHLEDQPISYEVEVHENPEDGGEVYSDASIKVTAVRTVHTNWKYAYGYLFEPTTGGKIMVSGDTVFNKNIRKASKKVDILVHEVFSLTGATAHNTPTHDEVELMEGLHTSGIELGKLANKAKPNLVVLTHVALLGQTPAVLLGEIAQNFDGPVYQGADTDMYSLKNGKTTLYTITGSVVELN
jgi:ribonuclease Z